jgi:3-phenylpropionate/trans-cinnamate dioxygenase ferredoxin subunit
MTMTRACSLDELADGKAHGVCVAGTAVVLVYRQGQVFALADECSHAAVPLSEGEVTRKGLKCWLHGSCFDLRTGRPRGLPATEPVETYAVTLTEGAVYVDPTAPATTSTAPADSEGTKRE